MKNINSALVFVFLLLTAAPSLDAAAPKDAPHGWCGTDAAALPISLARHEAFQRRLERERPPGIAPTKRAPTVIQRGNIAVFQDDGTVVIPPNLFDLGGRSIQFLRRPKGVSSVRSALGFKQLIGDRIAIGDDDSVRIRFPAGFRYPFGTEVYDEVFVNSDGNLTFGTPDSASSARDLNRFLDGPPRIAPLFVDLDPSVTSGDNGVFVSFPPNRVRITWVGVPEFGTPRRSTFQVTLFSTGRVNFAYGNIGASEAIVGVSAFLDDDVHLIDYNEELPFRPERVAIAEEFVNLEMVDHVAAARAFYGSFQDVYDFLSVWEDFPVNLQGAFAFALTVNNNVRGVGIPVFDLSSVYGSAGRLNNVLQMGQVGNYNPNLGTLVNRTYNSMGILAHEVGHRWLSFTRFVEPNGQRTQRLLGAGPAHWSHHMDTEGSLMEGNDYEDRGDGTFLITNQTTSGFSPVDQYLMGLRAPEEVPDFFYIDNPNRFDQTDVTFTNRIGAIVIGDRVDASVDGIIAAEGTRRPVAANAPTTFRIAFILVTRNGAEPTPESIDLLDTLIGQFPEYWQSVTDGRSTMLTTLLPR